MILDGQLDVPLVSMLEQKFEKSRFTRVDGDVIDRLIVKEEAKATSFSDDEKNNITTVFNSRMPKIDKTEFMVDVQALGETAQPVVIIQSEYMRRMKDISRYQPGMAFYAQMPDTYTVVLNSDHALIKNVLNNCTAKTAEELKPVCGEIKGLEARLAAIRQTTEKKKPEEITKEEKDNREQTEKAIDEQKEKRNNILAQYAKDNAVVNQLIDLALLQNGMLKGAALDAFLKRSVQLIKEV